MKETTIKTKNASGTDWPELRQRYLGPLQEQAEIMKSTGHRTLNRADVAGIFEFVTFFGGLQRHLGNLFHPARRFMIRHGFDRPVGET